MHNELKVCRSKSKLNKYPNFYHGLFEQLNFTYNKTLKNLKENSVPTSRFVPKSSKHFKVLEKPHLLINIPNSNKKKKYHLKLLKAANFDILKELNKRNETNNEYLMGKSITFRALTNPNHTQNYFDNDKKIRDRTVTTLTTENANSLNSTRKKIQINKNEDYYFSEEKFIKKKKVIRKIDENILFRGKIEDEKNNCNKNVDKKMKNCFSRNEENNRLPIFLRDTYNIKGTNIMSPFCIKARDEFLYQRIFKSKPKIKKIWDYCVDNKLNIFYAEDEKKFKENVCPKLKRGMKKDGINLINSVNGQLSDLRQKSKFIKNIIDYAYPEMVLGRIREANKIIKKSRNNRKNAVDCKAVDYEKRLKNKMITKNFLETLNIKKV